ncbi:hypothetical protein, partial [Zavarzinella formosa]|uniref:hypothetical protein n=1 Tax=Zavarzinella formosa TaxID=360055 RepID=UPI00138AE5B7
MTEVAGQLQRLVRPETLFAPPATVAGRSGWSFTLLNPLRHRHERLTLSESASMLPNAQVQLLAPGNL